ncbi:glutamate--tRNA ligase [Paracoccus litorisediminis]|uniref:glutamate--tRNA ligase n=1 Tax=Paracoccus litorisediminis TaxID=2006130 RepID=UPI00372E2B99
MFTTRIAPSPTGDFHIGTARTAYFNWLAAKASGGRFLLRIDDTDLARNNADSVSVIHDCMDWLGLAPDMIFRQSDRLDRYRAVADGLMAGGKAVVADNGAVLMAGGMATDWTDRISGPQSPSAKVHDLARNQVLIKADGMPVYHFASVVDDIDMGVNLVIRGIDHLTNTFRHSAIYTALGAALPAFAHLGLIMLDGRKMSKRDSAASLLSYRDAGVDPDGMLNFLLRMGWGPARDDKSMALIGRDRAVDLFLDGGRMRASPAGFDAAKLASFDRKYKAAKMRDRAS